MSASPTLPPEPNRTFHTPAGMPASWKMSVMSLAVHGVADAGFKTTVLPQMAPQRLPRDGGTGKFHGVTSATAERCGECQIMLCCPSGRDDLTVHAPTFASGKL